VPIGLTTDHQHVLVFRKRTDTEYQFITTLSYRG